MFVIFVLSRNSTHDWIPIVLLFPADNIKAVEAEPLSDDVSAEVKRRLGTIGIRSSR